MVKLSISFLLFLFSNLSSLHNSLAWYNDNPSSVSSAPVLRSLLPPLRPLLPPILPPLLSPLLPLPPRPPVPSPPRRPPLAVPVLGPTPPPMPVPVSMRETCSIKLARCLERLGGLIHTDRIKETCCPVLNGLVDLEAAPCLCNAIRSSKLFNTKQIPIAFKLLIDCGNPPPPGFRCAAN